MNERIYNTLEQALAELESGAEFETVLTAYPDLGSELEMAQMAQFAAQAEIPSGAASRSRTHLLARAMQLRQESQPSKSFFSRVPRFAITLVIIAVIMLSGSGLVAASAQAIPGDQLYPVKRSIETVRLGLAINSLSHQEIEEQYQSRRVEEVLRLLALGRVEMVQFYGVVEQQRDRVWMISGINIQLNPDTVVIGEIYPGMTVEVEGTTHPNGFVQASEIHLQFFSFVGEVESISKNAWQISGREVMITSESQIAADIQVGDLVTVTVRSDDFGSLFVRIIDFASQVKPTLPALLVTPTGTPSPTLSKTDADDEDGDKTRETGDSDDDRDDESETPKPEGTKKPKDTEKPKESDDSGDPDETDEPDETDKPDD